ncbi:hypothetical protein [Sulfitobacter sp. SK012]|uniref:hypothetical protein n=1 Tax=Sulfitobacter sp. SK012 TaxID=1389005 RepID=UPI0013B3E6D5|nr:hypothetical protein [Sulfitobacter sp. SK012]
MDTVYLDDALKVECLPGEGKRLVVVLSGIGHGFAGMQHAEFAGTASDGGQNTVMFVADRKRSWFSADGLVPKIADVVGEALHHAGLNACYTLGNSMGGYGAIRLTMDMPVKASLAFSPQFSMDRSVINEARWDQYRPFIDLSRHLPLSRCISPDTTHYAVFGAGSPPEVRHRDLLPHAPNLNCLMLPGAGHNIVVRLKETGHLKPLVLAMLNEDDGAIAQISARYALDIATVLAAEKAG